MRNEYQKLVEQTEQFFETRYSRLVAMKESGELENLNISLEELVDVGFCMKQIENLLDDLRKRYWETRCLLEKIVCARFIDQTINDTEYQPVRGEIATGTPNIQEMSRCPKKNSPEFLDLMNALGVSPGTELMFRIHWPTLVTYVTERKSRGLSIPKVLADATYTYPVYSVYYRKKNQPTNGDTKNGK